MTTQRPFDANQTKAAEPGRYLGFVLSDEVYAVPIRSVSEIIGMPEVTQIPNTPAHVKGVINLRGKVIPVIDLRLKFSLPEKGVTRETCTIVLDIAERQIGMIVDTVSEVIDFTAEQIAPKPDFGESESTRFISGIGKMEKAVVILLDADVLLSREEMGLVVDVEARTGKHKGTTDAA